MIRRARVKIQSRIDMRLHEAMYSLAHMKDWSITDTYEKAFKAFLEANQYSYSKPLERYVLNVPSMRTVQSIINEERKRQNENRKATRKTSNKAKSGNNRTV